MPPSVASVGVGRRSSPSRGVADAGRQPSPSLLAAQLFGRLALGKGFFVLPSSLVVSDVGRCADASLGVADIGRDSSPSLLAAQLFGRKPPPPLSPGDADSGRMPLPVPPVGMGR